ncbi:thioredoxin peroxidase [Candidatus Uhrbacteria bacterium RIFCSPHIGHO2_01_FULL_63_20]|uniref:Thioredoxin peroxidase n=1 Tax=Candidatus Uhrbacteria bacterium RIFCSPHIGHO2_01_FULL_63_20 TaxID=1802385 RepID=A0A1F7TKF8_9BACT|nr:MAG: thioredoxin peroxidase [Candidatus Uhrbacteria bacterium RIFCSPHIGHO2_01_FULL_63_20]
MIHVSQPAPLFTDVTAYHNGEFHQVNLKDYRGKWLVFFFYPRDFTFICPTELKGFATHRAEFAKLNAEVLAASTDSEWSHKKWFEADLPEVDYPVLADVTHEVSKAYDVYNEAEGLAERGLFIIDPEGMVRYALVSAGSVGRSMKETLRVLEALQTGERCPMEWEPGEKTLGSA